MRKNARLPKLSILLQFGGEILALSYPDDSIQTLLNLPWFLPYTTEVLELRWRCEGVGRIILQLGNRVGVKVCSRLPVLFQHYRSFHGWSNQCQKP